MALMSVDLPEPFGPRMATCSPCAMEKVSPSSARLLPRITVTFRSSSRAWFSIGTSGQAIMGDSSGRMRLHRFCLTLIAAAWPLFAQGNYEVQVYGSDLVAPGATMLEFHTNFTAEGEKRTIDGV